jgi:hypothetical protein
MGREQGRAKGRSRVVISELGRRARLRPRRLPARALPTAHFDRNKIHVISGTGHHNLDP